MSSNSSTSSSEPAPRGGQTETTFSDLERARVGRVPFAFLGLLLTIALVAPVLSANREWFADRAAWQWHAKDVLIDQQRPQDRVGFLGTSVLFHGVDSGAINGDIPERLRTVHLALNGLELPLQHQLLERYLLAGNTLDLLVLELRNAKVDRPAWRSGPYWQFWATFDEFLENRSYYFNPALLIPFSANRVLTSFAFREALDNFVFASVGARGLVVGTRRRNREMTSEILEHSGFSRGFEQDLTADHGFAARPEPWARNAAGELWLRRLLDLCRSRGIRVAILQPPAPPFVVAQRQAYGFYADFTDYVAALRAEYPELGLTIVPLDESAYSLNDFADHHHFSRDGVVKLTAELTRWLATQ